MSIKNTIIVALLLLLFLSPATKALLTETKVPTVATKASPTAIKPSAAKTKEQATYTTTLPRAMKASPTPAALSTEVTPAQIKTIESQAPNLSPKVLVAALKPYEKARSVGLDQQEILTIVDFSKPSTENRFYVIDFKHIKVLYNTLVAHGKNSGDNYAERFSNVMGTEESSLGLYLTEQPYWGGRDGYDLRLHGLTPGYNTNAERRAVIVHGANYVNPGLAAHGRLGRSWGCFALAQNMNRSVINTIKGGTLIFAYAPVSSFLRNATDISPYMSHYG